MKNLNPYSGLNQIRQGYLCVLRQIPLDHIRSGTLKVHELGYFFIFLLSTDWDKDPNRKGFIRHDLKRLSAIWNIPYTTLGENLEKLIKKKVIIKRLKTPKIPNFNRFTSSGAQLIAKETKTYTNEELDQYFDNLSLNSEIPLRSKRKPPLPFRVSSKSEFNRSDLQQAMFTEDDKEWIDNNHAVKEKSVNRGIIESDIVEVFFNGNWSTYKNHLV